MVGYVMESRKGKRTLVTLLVALTVATIGGYLLTMSIAAKPADAATCASYAYYPHRAPNMSYPGSPDPWLYAPGWVECTGTNNVMKQIYVKVELQRRNDNGGFSVIGTPRSQYLTNATKAWADAKFNCGYSGTIAYYRTKTTGYTVAYNGTTNGYKRTYGPTYSTVRHAYC